MDREQHLVFLSELDRLATVYPLPRMSSTGLIVLSFMAAFIVINVLNSLLG